MIASERMPRRPALLPIQKARETPPLVSPLFISLCFDVAVAFPVVSDNSLSDCDRSHSERSNGGRNRARGDDKRGFQKQARANSLDRRKQLRIASLLYLLIRDRDCGRQWQER